MSAFHTLSNSHVSEATASWLDRNSVDPAVRPETDSLPSWWVSATPYGWFVRFLDEDDDRWPDDLRACIGHARAAGADFIHFDRDEPAIDGLPVHEW